jgi:hypothetical protein
MPAKVKQLIVLLYRPIKDSCNKGVILIVGFQWAGSKFYKSAHYHQKVTHKGRVCCVNVTL